MTEQGDPTHLDPRTVEEYFRLGAKAAFVLHADPKVVMEIDPEREEITLTTPAAGSEPEVTRFERIAFDRIRRDGAELFRLTVDALDRHYEAYILMESVVDQLKAGASFRHSVSEALVSLGELLASRTRLTEEKVTGLIGELLVLGQALDAGGEEAAITAWLGPHAEEHDFGFHDYDAEVKTTKAEARVHLIGSETQLMPSPGRPLYLISVQVTRAGAADDAFTLPSLVEQTRGRLDQTLRTFDAALEGLGWRESDADLYRTRYALRSEPRAYRVDDEFPAITAPRLEQVVPQRANVVSVAYRVDVTDLKFAEAPTPLDHFCEAPE